MRKMRCISNLKIKELIQSYTSRMEWKEYTEELYKKDLNELDYCNGVVSHPEPDILECEVKWALRCTVVNNREGNGTPLQYSCLENPMDGGAW